MGTKITRNASVLQGVSVWASYYRENPHRFVHDYLHIDLKLFQKLLIVMMFMCTVFVFIATRGIGKTYLSALFCVVRCILYPGTKICVASSTRGQAITVLEKILYELKPNSPELCAEIDDKETKVNGTNAQIVFKNGSYIKVVTASDSSRGNRANVLLIDEFRLVSKDVINTVLRKFLTLRRMPKYSMLTNEEKKLEYDKEKNLTMYLSSAYFVDHWSYLKCRDTLSAMLDDKRKQFICGLPYQLSIREGLLDPDTVADEMLETDFNEIKFSMEYEALWWGFADGTFFDYNSIAQNRKIHFAMLPSSVAHKLGNNPKIRIQTKQNGELRLLSADIALMSSKKNNNDATSIFINQLMPNKAARYTNNIVYCDAMEGLHTEDQALAIRRLYDEYECDYIVLDTNGIGLGIYDCLARDISDPETGQVYPALSCCNDKTMADRCTTIGAEKVIWSIKATPNLNSDCAVLLREGFKSGKIRLLVNEYEAEEYLSELQGYSKLTAAEKLSLQMPYIHTTLLVDELVKLNHDESGGRIKITERNGMRKDRYSSLSYNYYVSTQLESKLHRQHESSDAFFSGFVCRPPKSNIGRW